MIGKITLALLLVAGPTATTTAAQPAPGRYHQQQEQQQLSPPPTPSPPLILRDIKNRRLRLSDYRGKVVLLNFWATWCPPCRAEMPDLIRWQKQYRRRGLQVIGVTYPPTDDAEVRQFVRRLGVNYPIARGTKQTKALFASEETLPLTVIIDRKGNVRDRIEGILLPEEFEQKIRPLLESGPTRTTSARSRRRQSGHSVYQLTTDGRP